MDYDKIYKKHKNPFGIKVHPLVQKILDYKNSGSAIEFGAGNGRNSLFLASSGFNVTATDTSKEGLRQIKEKAKETNISIEVKEVDATKFKTDKMFDVVVSTFMLHHISRKEGEEFIKNIKEITNSGGLNVLAAFTKDGDFYKDEPRTEKYYLEREEFKKIYKDWKILEFFEKEGEAFQKKPDGRSMFNVASFLIAQKQ